MRAIQSPHRDVLEAAFGTLSPAMDVTVPAMLVLCFTNRCGSNYLAQLLASTGVFNEAGEFFNAGTVLEHAARLGLRSLAEYVAALPALVPPHRILAAKAAADQLVMLADAGVLGPATVFVLLERRDRLAQAVSRVIASQNLQWSSAHVAVREDAALVYDRAAIAAELAKIALGNAGLYAFFAANGVAPVHVTYEEIVADPQPMLHALAGRLGLAGLRARPEAVTLRRQAGAVNRAWAERFRAETEEKGERR